MKNIFIILMLSFASLCQAQKSKLNYKKIYENVESEKLEDFLTRELKVDTVSTLQYACFYIKVFNGKRIDYLTVTGEIDKKYQKIIESNIYKKNAPWFKKNKGKTMWYVLPIVFGHIKSNLNERQIYEQIVTEEFNFYVIRELIRDFPNRVFILNTVRKLTNNNMQKIKM
jgi:hypothetical protein